MNFFQLHAQSIVANPGFDVNVSCPNQIGQIDKADGWSVWGGTPDYFHSCANATFPNFGTPTNNRGYRTPRSGDAYIGLFTHSVFAANGREFVGRALSTPMQPGITYYVSFYVCKADVEVLGHSTNNIGVRFSTVPYSLVNPDTALNNAHVWSNAIVDDTTNWVKISGSFVADSAYTFIGIGNYFSDAATTIIPGTAQSNYAYYLIDDVCVSQFMETCEVLTSRKEFVNDFICEVFPNPTTTMLNLNFLSNYNGEVRLYDYTGKLVYVEHINVEKGNILNIDIKNFSKGLMNLVINGKALKVQIIND
jgi:hypothetical protein